MATAWTPPKSANKTVCAVNAIPSGAAAGEDAGSSISTSITPAATIASHKMPCHGRGRKPSSKSARANNQKTRLLRLREAHRGSDYTIPVTGFLTTLGGGKGGNGTEAALGALEYPWQKLQLSKVYAGHHPDNRAWEKILKKLGFEFIENVFYKPTGLMHPAYVCIAPTPGPNTSLST